MSSSFAPGNEPPGSRPRFQFSLRTILALTALTAWLLGWAGTAAGIGAFVVLGFLALIEAGCTPGGNVLGVFVRNLFAYFVCSLAFGAVGFGLMYGLNPTGWFGTDQFLFAPLLAEKVPEFVGGFDHSDPQGVARMRVLMLPRLLQAGTILCTILVVVAHRVLAGRGGLGAYVVFWIVTAAVVYPLLGSWTGGGGFRDEGWLVQFGFGRENPGFSEFILFNLALGGIVLAGTLVMGYRSRPGDRCLSLHSPRCHGPLVRIGLGVPWLVAGFVPTTLMLATAPSANLYRNEVWTPPALAVGGVLGALVPSFVWLRRFPVPLILGGGFAAVLILPILPIMSLRIGPALAFLIGLLIGLLVVTVSWLLETLRVDDPGGATAVHGVAGVVGTVSPRFFGSTLLATGPSAATVVLNWHRLAPQVLGVVVCFVWSFGVSAAVFYLIKRTPGLTIQADRAPRQPAYQEPGASAPGYFPH